MPHPEIHAVTFDMDGLIFNTEDIYDEVGGLLCSRRGHVFTTDLKLKMMGLPGTVAFEVMRTELGIGDSAVHLQQETDEIFRDLLPQRIETMPGLTNLLDLLESLEIPKAVATSSHRNFARLALSHFDLEPRFEFVLTADDVSQGKPHPEVYQTSAERLGVNPENMLVLEDSLIGSTAGVAAGAFTIAVPTLHSQHQDFSHVQRVARSLADEPVLSLFR
jgi:HAD superfamily hydrolase (TIGR01509 family)